MSVDLGTAHGKIVLDYDSGGAVRKAESDIDRLEKKAKDGDRETGKLGKSLGALGKGVSLVSLVGSMTSAAASAASMGIQIAGMVPQLASLAALSAALPAYYAGLYGSIAIVKLAVQGVGEAITAAFDPEKTAEFEKALEGLSPNARNFAIAVKEAAPALKEMQQGIQDAFFSNNLEQFIPRIVAGLGSMRPTVNGLAADFGKFAGELARVTVDRDSFWEFLDGSLQSVRGNLAKLTPAIAPVVGGLLDVGNVGLPLMDRLGTAVAGAATKFGTWMSEISASGQLQEWIDTALVTLRQLGGLVSNVGSILTSVFQAAGDVGGGLLGTLEEITGEMAAFLKSAEGSEAIRSLFSGIMEVARQLAPIFTTVAGAIMGALGPALSQIANSVGPVLLQVVQALAPALAPVASAFASLVGAVAPLLPPIATLASILAQVLAQGVQNLVAALGPLIQVIGTALLGAFQQFQPVVAAVAQIFPIAAQAGLQLAQAFTPLIPVLAELASTIASSLVAVLPQLMTAFQQLMPVIIQIVTLLAQNLVTALNLIIPLIPPLVSMFASLYPVLAQVLTWGLKLVLWVAQLGTALLGFIPTLVSFVASFVSGLVTGIQNAYNGVVSFGASIISWFQQLPGRIMAFIQSLPGRLLSLISNMMSGAATAVGFGAGLIVGFFTKLVPQAISAIASLPGKLWNLITSAWNGAVSRTTSGINSLVSFARTLPGKVRSAIAALPGQLSSLATSAWNNMKSRTTSGINSVVSLARGLPGKIKSALSSLGSLLTGAGRSLMTGLLNGINSGIGKVLGKIRGLASQVKGAFNSALEIFSPSRVFKRSGQNITAGLVKGLDSTRKKVAASAKKLVRAATPKAKQIKDTRNKLRALPINPIKSLPKVNLDKIRADLLAAQLKAAQERERQAIWNAKNIQTANNAGLYRLEVDGRVLAAFMIDAITGNPTVVSKAADEGARLASWAGARR